MLHTPDPALLADQILTTLLWLFWCLCTAAVIVTALDLPAPAAFKRAVVLSAARGKTWATRPQSLGRLRVRDPRADFL